MTQQKEPDPKRTSKEWPAVSRQSEALKGIDKLNKSDEPAGKKLKKIVEDQSRASDEIAKELAAYKESTMPEIFPHSE